VMTSLASQAASPSALQRQLGHTLSRTAKTCWLTYQMGRLVCLSAAVLL